MAKNMKRDPWVWTAAGDAEGQIHLGSFQLPIYVRQIKLDTGATGGDFLITTASTSDSPGQLSAATSVGDRWPGISVSKV